MKSGLHRLAVAAALVAFCVIVLGAYVRLSHAGLGCPDWPGCYGHITWPEQAHEISRANEAFPERPVEAHKAWKEMVHRYLAGVLVLLVVGINVLAWKSRAAVKQRLLSGFLLVLILFQAALGMWTVTLKLLPLVVMAHLLGGLATFSVLVWLALRSARAARFAAYIPLRRWIIAGLAVLVVQMALGGWTSANYAALSCPELPSCLAGEYWPEPDFTEGFTLWREVGVNYEGGILDQSARIAIQLGHRVGAIITFVVLLLLALRMFRVHATARGGAVLLALLLSQVTLGILNVLLVLPLPNAVAHNAVAALLLAQLIWLLHRSLPQRN